MFKYLMNGLLAGIVIKLLDSLRRVSVQSLKIEATKCFVRGVQMARWSTIGLLCMLLMIGLIGVGLLLVHVALFMLLPWTLESKAMLGLFLGVLYMAIGAALLRAALNEKTWMLKSGLTDMLNDATGQPPTDSPPQPREATL